MNICLWPIPSSCGEGHNAHCILVTYCHFRVIYCLHCHGEWHHTTCSSTLMTETAGSSEQPVNTYQSTHSHIPGKSNLQHTIFFCLHFYANHHNKSIIYHLCSSPWYMVLYNKLLSSTQIRGWYAPINSGPSWFSWTFLMAFSNITPATS